MSFEGMEIVDKTNQKRFSCIGGDDKGDSLWVLTVQFGGAVTIKNEEVMLIIQGDHQLFQMTKPSPNKIVHVHKNVVSAETVGSGEVKKGSKKELAVAIVAANPEASRQQIIDLFMTQLNMSKAGAQTYYYTCKK